MKPEIRNMATAEPEPNDFFGSLEDILQAQEEGGIQAKAKKLQQSMLDESLVDSDVVRKAENILEITQQLKNLEADWQADRENREKGRVFEEVRKREGLMTDEKAFTEIKKLFDDNAWPDFVASGLGCIDIPDAWRLRKILFTKADEPRMFDGLVGLDSDLSWRFREILKDEFSHKDLLRSISFVDSPKARELRKKLMVRIKDDKYLIDSLAGLDNDLSWEWRKSIFGASSQKYYLLKSMCGLDSAKAQEMRAQIFGELEKDVVKDDKETPGLKATSLCAIDSDWSWVEREKLIVQGHANLVADSLTGLNSEKAWEMRERLMLVLEDHGSLIEGLAGLDDERAWKMRKEYMEGQIDPLVDVGQKKDMMVYSINGYLHQAIAWRARLKQLVEKEMSNRKID